MATVWGVRLQENVAQAIGPIQFLSCLSKEAKWKFQDIYLYFTIRFLHTRTVSLATNSQEKKTLASDWLPKPIKVSIFKEVRSVMVIVDLAPDVWDEALRKLEGELESLISDEEQSISKWGLQYVYLSTMITINHIKQDLKIC